MNKPFDIIRYRGKKIKVFIDFDGQSYYFIYKGNSYSCGTYNSDYISEIVSVVDTDLDKVFYVKPIAEHRPSAKVYKRYGLWYCNYATFGNLSISYGDLLKKKDRPNKAKLIERVHELMKIIDQGELKD
jgi:hypothetical protein